MANDNQISANDLEAEKAARNLNQIIWEMSKTERSFREGISHLLVDERRLDRALELVLRDLEKHPKKRSTEYAKLPELIRAFKDISQEFYTHSSAFSNEINHILDPEMPPDLQALANAMQSNIETIVTLADICSQMQRLQNQGGKEVTQHFNTGIGSSDLEKLPLDALLITPTQRIPRYGLLFRDLNKLLVDIEKHSQFETLIANNPLVNYVFANRELFSSVLPEFATTAGSQLNEFERLKGAKAAIDDYVTAKDKGKKRAAAFEIVNAVATLQNQDPNYIFELLAPLNLTNKKAKNEFIEILSKLDKGVAKMDPKADVTRDFVANMIVFKDSLEKIGITATERSRSASPMPFSSSSSSRSSSRSPRPFSSSSSSSSSSYNSAPTSPMTTPPSSPHRHRSQTLPDDSTSPYLQVPDSSSRGSAIPSSSHSSSSSSPRRTPIGGVPLLQVPDSHKLKRAPSGGPSSSSASSPRKEWRKSAPSSTSSDGAPPPSQEGGKKPRR